MKDHKNIYGYDIYKDGTFCEIKKGTKEIFSGYVEENLSLEDLYREATKLVAFYVQGKQVAAYDSLNESAGERENTINLLAEKYGCKPEDVCVEYIYQHVCDLEANDIRIAGVGALDAIDYMNCINVQLVADFDVDQYFGTNSRYEDGALVSLFANYYPSTKEVMGYYVIDSSDGEHKVDWEFSKKEQDLIINKMAEYCLATEGIIDLDEYYAKETGQNLMNFYVYNNLRSVQDNVSASCVYYNTLQEAIDSYNNMPKEWTTALGCSFVGAMNAIDLVHRIEGKNVFLQDYKRVAAFNEREDMNNIIAILKKALEIELQFTYGIHPYISVLTDLNDRNNLDKYYDNKVLRIDSEKEVYKAINEVYAEGHGWLSFNDFVKLNEDLFKNPYHPKVNLINVKYIEPGTGRTGQADLNSTDFILLKKKTIDYLKDKQLSLDKRIEVVKRDLLENNIANNKEKEVNKDDKSLN